MAKALIIAGDYTGKTVLTAFNDLMIATSFFKQVVINKDTVQQWEIINEQTRISAVSAIGRGVLGGVLLGPLGLLASFTAKRKGTHHVAIVFKDGKQSLLELDDFSFTLLRKSLWGV